MVCFFGICRAWNSQTCKFAPFYLSLTNIEDVCFLKTCAFTTRMLPCGKLIEVDESMGTGYCPTETPRGIPNLQRGHRYCWWFALQTVHCNTTRGINLVANTSCDMWRSLNFWINCRVPWEWKPWESSVKCAYTVIHWFQQHPVDRCCWRLPQFCFCRTHFKVERVPVFESIHPKCEPWDHNQHGVNVQDKYFVKFVGDLMEAIDYFPRGWVGDQNQRLMVSKVDKECQNEATHLSVWAYIWFLKTSLMMYAAYCIY